MFDLENRGFSVVELLIAISVFSIISLVGYKIYFQSNEINSIKKLDQKAIFLSEEGLEVSRAISRNSFDDLEEGEWGIEIDNNQWSFSGNSDDIDEFTRTIEVTDIDDDTKEVISNVYWNYKDREDSVSTTTYITNWNKEVEISDSDLVVDISGARRTGSRLRGILLSSTSLLPLEITDMEVSWTNNSRYLRRVRTISPNINHDTNNHDSGELFEVSNIVISPLFSRELILVFNGGMSNNDFEITFFLSDGTSETVSVTDV